MRKDNAKIKAVMRARRHRRVRRKIFGTMERPRLSVFRSAKHIVVQLIDDEARHTLASATDQNKHKKAGVKTERAKETGKMLAKRALELGIHKAVFDRGGYVYHGRVKAVADGAREEGLEF